MEKYWVLIAILKKVGVIVGKVNVWRGQPAIHLEWEECLPCSKQDRVHGSYLKEKPAIGVWFLQSRFQLRINTKKFFYGVEKEGFFSRGFFKNQFSKGAAWDDASIDSGFCLKQPQHALRVAYRSPLLPVRGAVKRRAITDGRETQDYTLEKKKPITCSSMSGWSLSAEQVNFFSSKKMRVSETFITYLHTVPSRIIPKSLFYFTIWLISRATQHMKICASGRKKRRYIYENILFWYASGRYCKFSLL